MSHHCHLRITPPQSHYDLSDALAHAEKYCVYEEIGGETQKTHLHIYLETDACESTIKSDIRRGFSIPVGQKGKNSAYFCCKYDRYKDPSPDYVAKDGSRKAFKGYTAAYLDDCETRGRERFGNQRTLTPVSESVSSKKDKAPHGEFDILLINFEKHDLCKTMDMPRIVKWIKSEYLCKRKCVPRSGDISRYAYSLYAIVRGNVHETQIEANDEHYLRYFDKPL